MFQHIAKFKEGPIKPTLIDKAAIDRGFLQSQAYFSQLSKSVNQPTSGRNHTQYFDL
jgi:hypothetical protein